MAWGLDLLTEGKWIFVGNISHLFPFLSCRPPRDLDSKACIFIGEEVRLRDLWDQISHPGLAACGIASLQTPKKRQIIKYQLLKTMQQPISLEREGSCWMDKS